MFGLKQGKPFLWAPILAALLLLLFAFAGCGGGGSESDSSLASGGGDSESSLTESSLTKEQFIRRANAICIENTQDIVGPVEEYMREHGNSGESKSELTADAVRQGMLPLFQTQVDQIRALGAPAGDSGEVERFLNSMQQAIDSLSQRQKLDLFTDIDEAFTRAKLAAQSYGLTGCL